jgi:hypothetical protein
MLAVGFVSWDGARDGTATARGQDTPAPAKAPPADGKAKAGTRTSLHDIMTRIGRGPRSLTPTIERAIREDEPAWDNIRPKTKEYVELVALVATYDPPRGSKQSWAKHAASFADAAAALDRAVEAKDKKAALAAHDFASNSCMSCHLEHRQMGFRGGFGGPGGPGGFGRPGQILPGFLQDVLKLTPAQRKQVDELQKETDRKLDAILTDAQRQQLRGMRGGFGRGGRGGRGGPPGGPPPDGSPGGPPGGGPPPGRDD